MPRTAFPFDTRFSLALYALIGGNEGLGDEAYALLWPTRTYLVEQADRRFYEEGFLWVDSSRSWRQIKNALKTR